MGNLIASLFPDEDDGDHSDYNDMLSEEQREKLAEDRLNVPSNPEYVKAQQDNVPVVEKITAKDIKNEIFRTIFESDPNDKELAKKIKERIDKNAKDQGWEDGNKHTNLIAFVLAVDRQNHYLVQQMMTSVEIQTLVTIALGCYNEYRPTYMYGDQKKEKKPGDKATPTKAPGAEANVSRDDAPEEPARFGGQAEGGQQIEVNNVSLNFEGGDSQGQEESQEYGGEGDSDDDSYDIDESSEEEMSEEIGWDGQAAFDAVGEEDSDEDGEEKDKDDDEKEKKRKLIMSEEITFSLTVPSDNEAAKDDWKKWSKKRKIQGMEIECTLIETKEQMELLKTSLQLRFPYLMANVVKMLLMQQPEDEEELACFLTAFYKLEIDQDLLEKGIALKAYKWMNFLWVFGKNILTNYIKDPDRPPNRPPKFIPEEKKISFRMLFSNIERVLEVCQNDLKRDIEEDIDTVCNWLLNFEKYKAIPEDEVIQTMEDGSPEKIAIERMLEDSEDDNILKALLYFQQQTTCIAYMGYYEMFLNQRLFLTSLEMNNETFIQQSLLAGVFKKQTFKDDQVIKEMLEQLDQGSKTFSLLNVLLMIDISLWSNDYLEELIGKFENFTSQDFDGTPDPEADDCGNRLAQCSNPLMIIALTCELLEKIASCKLQFRQTCDENKEGLLDLGKELCDKIDGEDEFKELLFDVDFQNRTLLSIIVSEKLEPLMRADDPKSGNIINEIFVGRGSINCDGNIYGYSTFMYILTNSPGKAIIPDFYQMITMEFEYKDMKIDYDFQHCYRRISFKYIYDKDFYAQLLMVAFCVWLPYYNLITLLLSAQEEVKKNPKLIPKHLQILDKWASDNSLLIFFNFIAYFAQALQRILFNLMPKPEDKEINSLSFDFYITVDILYAISSLTVYFVVLIFAQMLIETGQILILTISAVCVFVMAMVKFGSTFYCMEQLSILLLTLKEMLASTNPILVVMLIVLAATFQLGCTMLMDRLGGDFFPDYPTSVQMSFDFYMGGANFLAGSEEDKSPFEQAYWYFYYVMIAFFIFLTNILLFNFMVAILSEQYGVMSEIGSFSYKCMVYYYCEKLIFAVENPTYSELVLHPPPFNLFCVLLLPFLPFKKFMEETMSTYFSVFLFWFDNILNLSVFLVQEVVLAPLVYLKTFGTIVESKAKVGFFTTLGTLFYWAFVGIFYLLYIIGLDMVMFCSILSMTEGCKAANGFQDEEEDDVSDKELAIIFNEIRTASWNIYKKNRREKYQGKENLAYGDDDGRVYREDHEDGIPALFGNTVTITQDFDATVYLLEHFKLDTEWFEAKNQPKVVYEIRQVAKSDVVDEWQKISTERKKAAEAEKSKGEKLDDEPADPEEPRTINSEVGAGEDEIAPKQINQRSDATRIKQEIFGNKRHLKDKQGPLTGKEEDEVNDILIQEELVDKLNKSDDDGGPKEEEEESDNKKKADPNLKLVEEIMDKYKITCESAFNETVDLMLILMAMPRNITEQKVKNVNMSNFSVLQDAIVKFKNAEESQAFIYYDNRNVERVSNIRKSIQEQGDNITSVQKTISKIKELTDKNQNVISNFQEQWDKLEKAQEKHKERMAGIETMVKQESDQGGKKPKRRGGKK